MHRIRLVGLDRAHRTVNTARAASISSHAAPAGTTAAATLEEVRQLASALGAGAFVFGVLPALFPRQFARLFGIGAADDPTVATAIRSVGVRDMVTGLGLLQAARGGDARALRTWLLARTACDAGDTLAVGLTIAAGAHDPRFVGLGGLALGAAICGAALTATIPVPSVRRG